MTVTEYRSLNPSDTRTDSTLEVNLRALESAIRSWTNNNFQKRNFRFICPIINGKLFYSSNWFRVGDTIQISESAFNDGVFNIIAVSSDAITLDSDLYPDEDYCMVTKIVYPPDVKIGALNLMKWDNENRSKAGISSETLSRHSVTYADSTGENSVLGYPKALTGFLTPYMKARF